MFRLLKNCYSTRLPQRQLFSRFLSRRVYPAHEERSTSEERTADEFDVVIIGGGPSGLATAIRLKQLAGEKDLRVALVEKGSEIGAHILSGAILQPGGLTELIPDWKEKGAPVYTPVKDDYLYYLTEKSAIPVPTWGTPLANHGNYLISLGQLCSWLGTQAEQMGVEIYPGIAGTEVLFDEKEETVLGVATGDVGIGKDGKRTANFEPGMELRAKFTIFSEGCRGSLTKQVTEHFNLRKDSQHPTYGVGIKELWEIDPKKHSEGKVIHTLGWPLPPSVYGGSFMYHLKDNLVSIGFITGLDYENPYINPYKEFQRFKHHPIIQEQLEGGTCIKYGARAISEGGLQSIPKFIFPGGALVGDSAGFLNVAKLKGIQNNMKSGMLCAESLWDELNTRKENDTSPILLSSYPERFRSSWLYKDLHAIRNIRPAFSNFGLLGGLFFSGLEVVTRGKLPYTLSHHESDHHATKDMSKFKPIDYPKPDGKISFDILTNVSRSGTNHNEDQPAHLRLRDPKIPVEHNLKVLGGPESRFCPAGVYEFVENADGTPRLQINFSNCVHCKTCDIKDAKQNIDWTPPEGGNGPIYMNM